MKRVQCLYVPGSGKFIEDGHICSPPHYYGVFDGISGVYLPHEGPKSIHGQTGGQFAVHTLCHVFMGAPISYSPYEILTNANAYLAQEAQVSGLNLTETEFLPSAAFVVAKVSDDQAEIIQGGDCLAVWETENGFRGATVNKAYSYEKNLLEIIARLMKKHGGDRKKMWCEFAPILWQQRRQHINVENSFALFNGQFNFTKCWQVYKIKKLKTLILFSDGLVPFEWTETPELLALGVFPLFKNGGLARILDFSRRAALSNKAETHEDFPEATAIAIEF